MNIILNRILCRIISSLSIVLFISCSSDDIYYSCDSKIDNWVKENISTVQGMSRSDWRGISDYNMQIACYRAFTPTQKKDFWLDKLRETNNLPWSEDEKSHICKLERFILSNPYIFEDGVVNTDELEIWEYEWIEYAKEHLKWADNIIYSIAFTGLKLKDTDGTLELLSIENSVEVLSSSETCDCAVNSYNHCDQKSPIPGIVYTCESGNCNKTSSGCGWLFLYECDGTCVF